MLDRLPSEGYHRAQGFESAMEHWAHCSCDEKMKTDDEADPDYLFEEDVRSVSDVGCEGSNLRHDLGLRKGSNMANSSAGDGLHQVSPVSCYATSPLPHLAPKGTTLAVLILGKCRHQILVHRRAPPLSAYIAHVHQDATEFVKSAIARSQVVRGMAPKAARKGSQWAVANGSIRVSCTLVKDLGAPTLERQSHFLPLIDRRWKVVVG